jgi:hypothetical protein
LGAPGMPGVCLACDRLIAELSDSLLSVWKVYSVKLTFLFLSLSFEFNFACSVVLLSIACFIIFTWHWIDC